MLKIRQYCCLLFMTLATSAYADLVVPMYDTVAQGTGKSVGTITIKTSHYGLLLIPDLHDMTPGLHGFHVHEKPSCADQGMAAGGHLDPKNTKKHLGPFNDQGHLGDLATLFVNADGTSTLPVLAPKLKSLSALKNHALMIHEGGDNYSDIPAPLGGGGGRMVCGVME